MKKKIAKIDSSDKFDAEMERIKSSHSKLRAAYEKMDDSAGGLNDFEKMNEFLSEMRQTFPEIASKAQEPTEISIVSNRLATVKTILSKLEQLKEEMNNAKNSDDLKKTDDIFEQLCQEFPEIREESAKIMETKYNIDDLGSPNMIKKIQEMRATLNESENDFEKIKIASDLLNEVLPENAKNLHLPEWEPLFKIFNLFHKNGDYKMLLTASLTFLRDFEKDESHPPELICYRRTLKKFKDTISPDHMIFQTVYKMFAGDPDQFHGKKRLEEIFQWLQKKYDDQYILMDQLKQSHIEPNEKYEIFMSTNHLDEWHDLTSWLNHLKKEPPYSLEYNKAAIDECIRYCMNAYDQQAAFLGKLKPNSQHK